jgi:hypothetical protein
MAEIRLLGAPFYAALAKVLYKDEQPRRMMTTRQNRVLPLEAEIQEGNGQDDKLEQQEVQETEEMREQAEVHDLEEVHQQNAEAEEQEVHESQMESDQEEEQSQQTLSSNAPASQTDVDAYKPMKSDSSGSGDFPSSPPNIQTSSSYVPSSEADYKNEDDDAHLDREKCETVTQMMLLAFLNAILNRLYHLSIEDIRAGAEPSFSFSFEYIPRRAVLDDC